MKPVAVVTGATKGIGRAICKIISKDFDVVGIARSKDSMFPGTLYQADLLNSVERNEVFKEIADAHDVTALVNNVGFNQLESVGNITSNIYDKIMQLNVTTTLEATQCFLPGMKRLGYGRIVNMGARAFLGRQNSSVYAAAKSAVIGLTKSWALELAADNITVNCIAPGPIETDMLNKNVPLGTLYREKVINDIPLKRLGTPDEVASLAQYLLSPQAGFITGQTIFVCGGSSISIQTF